MLRDIYLSQGISFTQPSPVRVAALRKHQYLERQRFIFACRLTQLLMQDANVIYMDEVRQVRMCLLSTFVCGN